MSTPVALVVGPDEHGVVLHARQLAAAGGWPVAERAGDVPRGSVVVLDVTDRLFGATADVSGPRINTLVDTLHAADCRVVASVHDVPFDGDGPVQGRRAEVYRALLGRVDAVFVASRTERERLGRIAPGPARIAVVALPVPPAAPTVRHAEGPLHSVSVLGFLYPGKGHEDVLAAMSAWPVTVPLVCVGRAADGHDDLVDALRAAPRPVQITGFVPDAELGPMLRAATVPVAPNRVPSASASITTWWSYGRRPLVPDSPYARELLEANPDSVALYTDLAWPLARAYADPDSTWLPVGAVLRPGLGEAVAEREAAIDRWWP